MTFIEVFKILIDVRLLNVVRNRDCEIVAHIFFILFFDIENK